MLKVYNIVKEYYPFYYSDNSSFYFQTDEFKNLFHVVKNKFTNTFYNNHFKEFTQILKSKYPESDIYEIKNNKPSHTLKINYFYDIPPFSEIIIYISFSLLMNNYVLFIDCKSSHTGKCTFSAPFFEMSSLFLEIDKLIEEYFVDYGFFYPSFLMANFFNLTVPGYTKSSNENGIMTKKSNLLNAIFFEYDNFNPMDKYYKQDNNLTRIPLIEEDIFNEYLELMTKSKQNEILI